MNDCLAGQLVFPPLRYVQSTVVVPRLIIVRAIPNHCGPSAEPSRRRCFSIPICLSRHVITTQVHLSFPIGVAIIIRTVPTHGSVTITEKIRPLTLDAISHDVSWTTKQCTAGLQLEADHSSYIIPYKHHWQSPFPNPVLPASFYFYCSLGRHCGFPERQLFPSTQDVEYCSTLSKIPMLASWRIFGQCSQNCGQTSPWNTGQF